MCRLQTVLSDASSRSLVSSPAQRLLRTSAPGRCLERMIPGPPFPSRSLADIRIETTQTNSPYRRHIGIWRLSNSPSDIQPTRQRCLAESRTISARCAKPTRCQRLHIHLFQLGDHPLLSAFRNIHDQLLHGPNLEEEIFKKRKFKQCDRCFQHGAKLSIHNFNKMRYFRGPHHDCYPVRPTHCKGLRIPPRITAKVCAVCIFLQ